MIYPWTDILLMIAGSMLTVLINPIFWLVMLLVGLQYRQMNRGYQSLFGVVGFNLPKQLMTASLFGFIGGIFASFLLTLIGVNIDSSGLIYVWPVAIVLAFIHMRFICFAYAGGLLAISKLLFDFPDIDVLQVLALVAILHITESILIAVSGSYSTMPLYLRRNGGQVVGAFSLHNFWPVPLLVLILLPMEQFTEGMLNMPDWWPILKTKLQPENIMFALYPVVAGLGYVDISITTLPGVRRRQSALQLAAYSLVLLLLVLLAGENKWLQIVAALVAPIGHELIIQINRYRETHRKALFVPSEIGLTVLDTVPDSPGRQAGIKPADILLRLDEVELKDGYDLAYAIRNANQKCKITLLRQGSKVVITAEFKNKDSLGIILVPAPNEGRYVEMK